VLNWPEYEAELRRRGSLTVWISEEAVTEWADVPRTTPAGRAGMPMARFKPACQPAVSGRQPQRARVCSLRNHAHGPVPDRWKTRLRTL
jgi:hypothetical protein